MQIVDAFSCEVLRMYVSGPLHLSLSLLLAYQDKLDQHLKHALGPPASLCSANILGVVGTFVQVKVKVTLKVELPLVPDLNPKLLDALKIE